MRAHVVNLPAVSGLLIGEPGCVRWHMAHETSGTTAARYRLWDGGRAAGTKLVAVSLSANESTRDYIGAHVLEFEVSLYFELVSGAVEGSVAAWIEHSCAAEMAEVERLFGHG